jgi:uncharacterized protein YifE (UPF0438 family)
MAGKKIEVSSYAGHRGEERPLSFVLDGERIEVLSVVRTWIEESFEDRKRKRFFMVSGSDGYTHTLYQDGESLEWGIKTT